MIFSLLLLGLAGASLPLQTEGACPGSSHDSGKRVFCYYEGKRSPSEVDPCPCSHILYKNIQIDQQSRLKFTNRLKSDVLTLKEANPRLSILVSLGGDTVTGDVFRSIVSRKDQLSNFTDSLNSLYQDEVIQGIEMDWEWPMDTNDKKDKIKLIRYLRQLKIATGDENVKRRIVRNAETTTIALETTTVAHEDANTAHDDIVVDDGKINDSDTTTEWSPQRESEENDEITTHSPTTSLSDVEETTQNWRKRGFKRKRIKGARKTTTEAQEATKPTEAPDYEERILLEDVLFSDEDNFLESPGKQNFFIALRLSPFPEHLVKGYEFKMLNKFVDVYTLNSHNLTQKYQNTTFHHSRLMGVSDIYNSDALIDVVVGLGAPIEKIILNTPAFGNSFNLMSKDKNLPGSATTGLPQTVTYQQVCQILTKGNWTLERDEDLTGPYSYLGTKWVAFDDDTSIKIKAKYVLLRDMAGIGLMSIDADDVDDLCGKGKHSLLNTIGSVISNLQRKPRQLIVTSLEQDLLATAQNFVPVTAAQGLRVSPFRIVRIVDREGQIQSIRENSETVLECSRQGYYRHPEDCSRFYRCVKFNQYENDYTIFEYGCPDGLVFDDRWEVCVWPSQATPCDGSSEIFPIPKNDYVCPGEGFFVDPENCRWFFACRDHLGDGTYTHYEFRCPFGLAFDEANLRCEWPWLVSACDNEGGYSVSSQLPSRKDFASSYNPGGNNSPFPSVPSIPNFESSRTAIPSGASNRPAFHNVPRGSVESSRTSVPSRASNRPAFNAIPSGDVAKDSCENCFSNVLTLTGRGHTNGNGIEVAGPVGAGSNFRNSFRNPKSQQFPATAIPSYSPSTTLQPVYSPSTTLRPITTAKPTTTYTEPSYGESNSNGRQSDNGYNYPVPLNPLEFPSTTLKPYKPTSTSRPEYKQPTTTHASYNPSTTAHSSFTSPQGPSLADQVPTQGYNYPVPQNPLQIGISVSNPGEIGLIPSHNIGKPVTPNLPAYGVSSTYPTTTAAVSSTYGAPVSGSYQPSVSTTYAPSVSTSYAPAISSTYAPPVSSTYQPAAPVSTSYGAPTTPTYNTYRPPTPPPSYKAPQSYEPIEEPSKEYGVPAAPVISTTFRPAINHSPAYEPSQSYGVPSGPVISTTYGPIKHEDAPLESYGTPIAPTYNVPEESYNIPKVPSQTAPKQQAPAETYGVPLGEPIADETYGIALSQAYDPSDSDRVPAFTAFSTTFRPDEYEAEAPSKSYGAPSAPVISSTYKPNVHQNDPYKEPSISYGVPSAPVVSTTYTPSYNEPNQSPSQSYGVPLAPVVSSTYAPNPSQALSQSYGVPLAPIVTSTYAPIVKEVPLPNYSKPQSTYDAGRPASLPASWPNYPSSNDNYTPSVVKELPTPPEIRYGGFKPPSIPEPIRLGPVYQQPTYSGYPSRPNVDYGGFKGISSRPVDSYNNAKPLKPVYNPITPNIPAYGPTSIKSNPSSGYSYPVPKNPLNLPTTRKPSYNPTSAPVFVSTTPVYASTRKPYNPTTLNLPAYGSTTLQPSYNPSTIYSVSSTHAPAARPTKLPTYNPSTPKPFVDFGSDNKKEPSNNVQTSSGGYKYPVPSNPLEYPQRTGRTGPNNKAEVGSVIPVGFSSATLSNGPFSSISSASDNIRGEQRQQKSFVSFGNNNGPSLDGNSKNEISSSFGGNKLPNPRRPAQSGPLKDRNVKKISGFDNGQNQPTLQAFTNFGGSAKPQSDSLGSQSASTSNFETRPGLGGTQNSNFGRQQGSIDSGREEARGGRQGFRDSLADNTIEDSSQFGKRPDILGSNRNTGRPVTGNFGSGTGITGPGLGGDRGSSRRPGSSGLSGRPGPSSFGLNNQNEGTPDFVRSGGRTGGSNRNGGSSPFGGSVQNGVNFGTNRPRSGTDGSDSRGPGGFGSTDISRPTEIIGSTINSGRPEPAGGRRPGSGGAGRNSLNGIRPGFEPTIGSGGSRGSSGNRERPVSNGFRGNAGNGDRVFGANSGTGERIGSNAFGSNTGTGGRPGSSVFGSGIGNGRRPGSNGLGGNRGRPGSNAFGGNLVTGGISGAGSTGGNARNRERPRSGSPVSNSGRPRGGSFGDNRGNGGGFGSGGLGGNGGRPGSIRNTGRPASNGLGGNLGNRGRPGNSGQPGFGGVGGRPGTGVAGLNRGNVGRPGTNSFGGNLGSGGRAGSFGSGGNAGNAGRPGTGNSGGRPGIGGNNGNIGRPGAGGFGGNSGLPGTGGFNGGNGLGGFGLGDPDTDARRGKEVGGFGGGVTSVRRPVQNKPAVLGKLAGNNWNSGTWEKFGPGGYRSFNETLGPEVCQRPGLFRHPADCTKFYECYWDKWIEKFTLHIFPCPVAMAVRQYDETISACNWPFLGPNCEGNTIIN